MSETSPTRPAPALTPIQWLICIIAALGFAFDTYELLMLPLVVRPALLDIGGIAPGTPEFNNWVGALFYVPALFGGVFGLIGGYLTDRFGRRQVLVWSILLYAFSALAAGFATSLPMLLFFRVTTFIGVCVEFVAAIAWLAELFPEPRQREKVLGFTQAFSSFGGIMVTGAYYLAVANAGSLPAIFGEHAPWRYTLISGVIPALPLILIRPFLPESPLWREKKAAGTLRRPSIMELFRPAYLRTTLITTLLMACAYGAAFGAIQHVPRIVPGLPEVTREAGRELNAGLPQLRQLPDPQRIQASRKLMAASRLPRPRQAPAIREIAELQQLPPADLEAIVSGFPKASAAAREKQEKAVSLVQGAQEIGGLIGRFVLALLAVVIVSRQGLLRMFLVPGLIIVPLVFFFPATNNLQWLQIGIFVAGLLTVGQFSFWGNYLPRVYPTHLRGTGESFAANIGGRMIGTSAALLTTQLANVIPGATPPTQLAYAAGTVALLVYGVGLIGSFWLPEPKEGELPE
jgi:MFS family permease